jgi:2-alkyl-3-oxoalkanoate reductase
MTDLNGRTDLRHFDRVFANSNKLRTRGLDIMLSAARQAGIKRFIAQSFCGWPYAPEGSAIKGETDPLDPNPPMKLRSTLDAIKYLEQRVTTSIEPEGVVLRYGAFYGPGTGALESGMIEQIRGRRVPLIGDGGGWWSFVHVDDAAEATVKAIDHAKPGNIYNICDDHPAKVREWLPALGEMLGAKAPFHLPAWLARIIGGEHLVSMMTRVRGGSNAKAKSELGWQPSHPSWRRGFADILEKERQSVAQLKGVNGQRESIT